MTQRGSDIERMAGADFGANRARMSTQDTGTAAGQRRTARGNTFSAASRSATPAQTATINKAQSKFSSGPSFSGPQPPQRAIDRLSTARQSVDALGGKKTMLGGDKKTTKIKNPTTGKEILATTALAAGPNHPAYQTARTALKMEIAKLVKELNFDKRY